LPGEQTTKGQLNKRAATVVAAVVVVFSVAAGALLQHHKDVVPSKAAAGPTATVTATATASAATSRRSPSMFPTGNMRVALTKLCSFESFANSQGSVGGECPVAGVSVPVNRQRFAYQSDVGPSTHSPATWNDWIGFENSDCTHVHLLFALNDKLSRPGDVAHVRVVRRSGTTHSTTGRGAVGVLDAALDGRRKPFTLSSRATHSAHVYMRGYVVCPR
jgi:hypothetical protein